MFGSTEFDHDYEFDVVGLGMSIKRAPWRPSNTKVRRKSRVCAYPRSQLQEIRCTLRGLLYFFFYFRATIIYSSYYVTHNGETGNPLNQTK